jgi:hypothetical protein
MRMNNRLAAAAFVLVAIVASASLLVGCAATQTRVPADGSITARAGIELRAASPLSTEQRAALAPVAPANAHYSQNRGLTAQQATERLDIIDSEYVVGQAFSPADTEFIRIYATPAATAFPNYSPNTASAIFASSTASHSFDQSKTLSGVTGRAKGTASLSGGPLSYRYATTMKVTTSSKATKVKMEVQVRSYGLVGSDGIGITYSTNQSATSKLHSYNFSRSGSYTSLEVYSTIRDAVTVTAPATSFNL